MKVVIRKTKKVIVKKIQKFTGDDPPFLKGYTNGLWCNGDIGKEYPRHETPIKTGTIKFSWLGKKLLALCPMCDLMRLYFQDGRANNVGRKPGSKKEKNKVVIIRNEEEDEVMAKKLKKALKKVTRQGTKGKNWGLSIPQSWEKLFKENERPSWHKSDVKLSKLMQREFPGREAVMFTDPKHVRILRSMFNRDGLWVKRSFSKGVVSNAYDKNGNKIPKYSKKREAVSDVKPPKSATKKKVIAKRKVVIIKRKK